MSSGSSSPPWGLHWRSSTLFITATVGIGLFTDLFLYGLVVPILPFILKDRIHLPDSQIQSHVSGLLAAYAGASVVSSIPAGIIADRTNARQTPFLVGLVALLGATLMLSLGQNVPVLVIARVLQGISAAVVWTVGLALVMDTVGPDNLGKTIGSIFGFISMGELAAPVLGGIIYDRSGYIGVFGLSFAIIALDFIMRLLLIEKKIAVKYQDSKYSNDQDTLDGVDGHNGNEDEPLLGRKKELEVFKISPDQPRSVRAFPLLICLADPRLLTALFMAFNHATLLATFDATIPTIAQELFHFDSLKAGLLFVPLILPYLVFGPVAGSAVDRYGTKPAAAFGFAYLVPVLILFRLVSSGGKTHLIIYCVLLAFSGLGLAIVGSPSIVEASTVVKQYDKANPGFFGANGPYAQLYGINSMVFSAGLTLGPLLAGGLKDSIGYGNMNIVIAAMCAVTATLSFVFVGGKPRILGGR